MEPSVGDTGVSQERVVQYLTEVEAAAEDVLTDKETLVVLDKKRQGLREAISALRKTKEDSSWICSGDMFIQCSSDETRQMLEQDMKKVEEQITKTRTSLKSKVNKLNDSQKKEEIKGFHLEPISKDELESLKSY